MNYHLHECDIPQEVIAQAKTIAIDCEAMGLNLHRDRLCLVQLSLGDGVAHLVKIAQGQPSPSHLTAMLTDASVLKLFHFGRFDIAALYVAFGVLANNVYCTKIASKLARTYTDKHNLSTLVSQLLGIELSKESQMSDWGHSSLTEQQLVYAAQDVLYLHQLKEMLDAMLSRENRRGLAISCFDFLPTRALLDVKGWPDSDIFSHK